MKLSDGTLLQGGKYKIVRFISHGGFGCTYEALNTTARNRRVAIKELFVSDFCNRDNSGVVTVATHSKLPLFDKLRGKFLDEADTLYNLNHPSIVRVLDSFEENGTAYYVMDYIEGCSLRDYVRRNGAMSESRALGYIRALADALQYVHSKDILHLDIKPANVMVTHDNKVVLIDFGVSKQYDEVSGENTSTLMGRSPGYAPVEQMKNSVGTFMPATDIYALGATLYNLLSGVTPPESTDIAAGDAPPPLPDGVSEATRRAVERAMAINKYNRPQSVAEFLALLDGKGAAPQGGAVPPRKERTGGTTIIDGDKEKKGTQHAKKNSEKSTSTPDPDKEKKPKRWLWILLAVLLGFVVGAVGYYQLSGNSTTQQEAANEQTTIVADSVQTINADSIAKARQDSILRHHKDSLDRANKQRQDSLDQARIEAEKAEQERKQKEEQERIAEQERLEAEQAEQERKQKEEQERIAEQERLDKMVKDGKGRDGVYQVGDYYNRDGVKGVVFAVWDGGRHGKIVSMDETHLPWCTSEQYGKYIAVGASSRTDGKYNTDKIAQYGLSNYPPAQWCREKGSNWYLPAKNELWEIYNNNSVINATLKEYGGMKLRDSYYWSSTEYTEYMEYDDICAWPVDMGYGYTGSNNKNNHRYVRAVSAF